MNADTLAAETSHSIVLNRRTRWIRNSRKERTEFCVSFFHFHEEEHGHTSFETRPTSSRFSMVPSSFQKVCLLLKGLARKNPSMEIDLDTLEEQNLLPRGPLRRTWTLKWRWSTEYAPFHFSWVGKAFPVAIWLKWVRELRNMPEPAVLSSIDLPIKIPAERLPCLSEYDQNNGFLRVELLRALNRNTPPETHYQFRGWHPRFGLILRKGAEVFAFQDQLPSPTFAEGPGKRTCFNHQILWCPDLWIEVPS